MKGAVRAVDPITTEVIHNFLTSCANDMNAALFRSAYTPIIYEGRDCAVALMDREANPLGQSTGVPLFLCNLEVCVRHALEHHGLDWFEPGDVVIMNDPYIQGTHLHDVTVFGPIFYEEQLVGFAASRAHWQDVGGKDIGSTMRSVDVYQEGFRLAPTKVVSRYQPDPQWMDFLRRNSRLGYELIGDLDAQIAACRTGEERVRQMLDRVGLEVFEAAKEKIFEQAAERHRAAVAALPDGVYRAEGELDNDGVGSDPVRVAVEVTIEGERFAVDLTGTAPPQLGPVNCGYAQAVSAIQLAYKSLIRPDMAVTGGTFDPLEVTIPDHCCFNAREPVACEWYFTGLGLLITLIISAVGEALGEDAVCPDYGDSMVITIAGERPDRSFWVSSEPTAGGWGAHGRDDGESALISLANGAFKNIPVEVYESKYPVQIDEFAIRTDSGGPGRLRGGCGVRRTYRLLEDASLSLWLERSRTPAWGLAGGSAGAGPDCQTDGPAGHWQGLKVNRLELPAQTVITLQTGGGGGFGDPLQRDPERVCEDVRRGLVSARAARERYGVALDPHTLEVEPGETERLRGIG
ncbi:MAG TPA: hydantoinase B/oxoprolinase family protein [Solirubrobacterales bacterium]|nr:hydantoinase B/oxoprolinase family protein [Solirubrobacterales bacterium]